MAGLDLPVYPARARCTCTHGLYAHRPRCSAGTCPCRRFDAAGGLVPLEVEQALPFESTSIGSLATLLDQ